MHSIFTTLPPSFSTTEVSAIIKHYYGMNGTFYQLYSDRDQIFLISANRKKYILKISNPAESRSVLDLQDAATQYILKKDPNINIPQLVGEIYQERKDGQLYLIRLLTYVEGDLMSEKTDKPKGYEQMGCFLGRLSNSLKGFDHSAAHREFEWDARQINFIHSHLDHIGSSVDQHTICHFINEYEKHVIPESEKLRMSVIHNDGNDHNIIVDKDNHIIGIIDLGDMVYSFTVFEPAICMAYIAINEERPFSAIADLLKGYSSIHALDRIELYSAVYLMCLRLCTSVTMAAWRKKIFPNNEYLTISERSAWTFLKKMQNEDLDIWSKRLVEHAK